MSIDIFKGIEKAEVEQFSKRLALERQREHRFAAIQIKGETLAEKDITFHKTAFEACKYILMAPTDKGYYTFRSLSLLEDDAKRILKENIVEKEQDLKNVFAMAISKQMAKADWYYDYSDWGYKWNKGKNEIKKIIADLKLLSRLDGGIDKAKELWKLHVPPHSINEPVFFSKPKLLDNAMSGIIMRQDIASVQKALLALQKEGYSFVTLKSDILELPQDRVKGFTSITDARNYVDYNSSPSKSYLIYSIAALKIKLQQALAPTKDNLLQNITERLNAYQKEENRSRENEPPR